MSRTIRTTANTKAIKPGGIKRRSLHTEGGTDIPPKARAIPRIPTHDYSNIYGWNLDGRKMR